MWYLVCFLLATIPVAGFFAAKTVLLPDPKSIREQIRQGIRVTPEICLALIWGQFILDFRFLPTDFQHPTPVIVVKVMVVLLAIWFGITFGLSCKENTPHGNQRRKQFATALRFFVRP